MKFQCLSTSQKGLITCPSPRRQTDASRQLQTWEISPPYPFDGKVTGTQRRSAARECEGISCASNQTVSLLFAASHSVLSRGDALSH